MRSHLEASFPLRCFQRLSIPNIATRASRILVHDFASRTLDQLLGEQRTRLADEVGRAVQADLQKLDSGVEILATVVEAI
ncbi:hypothetical protein F0170_00860, partial [Pseudomonas sp. MAFF 730085]|nr:hypothetical protein [Pseudomonas kitaguniensis]